MIQLLVMVLAIGLNASANSPLVEWSALDGLYLALEMDDVTPLAVVDLQTTYGFLIVDVWTRGLVRRAALSMLHLLRSPASASEIRITTSAGPDAALVYLTFTRPGSHLSSRHVRLESEGQEIAFATRHERWSPKTLRFGDRVAGSRLSLTKFVRGDYPDPPALGRCGKSL